MEPIRNALQGVMQELQKKQGGRRPGDPQRLLRKIFSDKERKHVRFEYFNRGTVRVAVDSSAWLYYLSLQKETFLGKLKKHLSGAKDIRFYLGEPK